MKAFNWTKWSAIAEIISSVAILITLVYLAIQTQQTNNALVASSRQATMAAEMEMISAVITAPEAWDNFNRPFSEMTFAEQNQAANLLAGMLRVREFAWFQYQNGIMDEQTLRSYLAPVPRWLRMGDNRVTWEEFARELDPEFVVYVEAMLAEAPN